MRPEPQLTISIVLLLHSSQKTAFLSIGPSNLVLLVIRSSFFFFFCLVKGVFVFTADGFAGVCPKLVLFLRRISSDFIRARVLSSACDIYIFVSFRFPTGFVMTNLGRDLLLLDLCDPREKSPWLFLSLTTQCSWNLLWCVCTSLDKVSGTRNEFLIRTFGSPIELSSEEASLLLALWLFFTLILTFFFFWYFLETRWLSSPLRFED